VYMPGHDLGLRQAFAKIRKVERGDHGREADSGWRMVDSPSSIRIVLVSIGSPILMV
jgi:hypothetical protein